MALSWLDVGALGLMSALALSPDPAVMEPESAPAAKVTITNHLTFIPHLVTIEAGESVLWVNGSNLLHTVTADPEYAYSELSFTLPEGADPFHSGPLAPGHSFEHRFEVPGTYKYFCNEHEDAAAAFGWIQVTGE